MENNLSHTDRCLNASQETESALQTQRGTHLGTVAEGHCVCVCVWKIEKEHDRKPNSWK